MPKKRKWTDEQLVKAVKNNESVFGVLRELGLKLCGGSHALVKQRMKQLELDNSHFTGQGWCTGDKHERLLNNFVRLPLEQILVKNSTYLCTNTLKNRLLKEGILKNECAVCGMKPIWNKKPLSLQLDHIDGDRCNNTKENLRIICPNCHAQTDSYAGKNRGRVAK